MISKKGRKKILKEKITINDCFKTPLYSIVYTLIDLYPQISSENIRKILKEEETKTHKDKYLMEAFKQIKNTLNLTNPAPKKHKYYYLTKKEMINPKTQEKKQIIKITSKTKEQGFGITLKENPIKTYFTKIHKIENKTQKQRIVLRVQQAYELWKKDVQPNPPILEALEFTKESISTNNLITKEDLDEDTINFFKENITEKQAKELENKVKNAQHLLQLQTSQVEFEANELISKHTTTMLKEMKNKTFNLNNKIIEFIIITLMEEMLKPEKERYYTKEEIKFLYEVLEKEGTTHSFNEKIANALGVSTYKQNIERHMEEITDIVFNVVGDLNFCEDEED